MFTLFFSLIKSLGDQVWVCLSSMGCFLLRSFGGALVPVARARLPGLRFGIASCIVL
ncbi:hypothetical protein KCP77_17210 [Salmonella enterica subsp. enterica]|nr:hypothetical protein KCP77_17210 [Salmonella enterica subsp. enterica]